MWLFLRSFLGVLTMTIKCKQEFIRERDGGCVTRYYATSAVQWGARPPFISLLNYARHYYITTHKLERPFGTKLRVSRTAVAAEVLACCCSNAARVVSTPRKALLVFECAAPRERSSTAYAFS
eukprot:m.184822 g.184822  ORF g.184822 m.184822 type:complete len:123 (+) comp14721_c1_seq1:1594-1962(+)